MASSGVTGEVADETSPVKVFEDLSGLRFLLLMIHESNLGENHHQKYGLSVSGLDAICIVVRMLSPVLSIFHQSHFRTLGICQ